MSGGSMRLEVDRQERAPKGLRGFRTSYARLARAQKGHARGAPAYSIYVNRRIGRMLAAFAYAIGLTPNQVTAISALHTFVGIGLIIVLPPSWWSGVIIGLLLMLGYAWDSADGQVARLSGGGSPAGEWLDHFVDATKLAILHLAVLVALWWHTDLRDSPWLIVPLVFAVASMVTFFGMILNDLIRASNSAQSSHDRGGGTLLRSLVLVPTDYGFLCIVFLLWGATSIFLPLYTALAGVAFAFLAMAAVKWFREMKRI